MVTACHSHGSTSLAMTGCIGEGFAGNRKGTPVPKKQRRENPCAVFLKAGKF